MNANPSAPTLRSPKLIEHERDALSDLLTLAEHHDLVVEKAYRVVYDAVVNVPGQTVTADPLDIEIMLGDWTGAITDLHAIVGRAALERAPLYAPFDPRNYGLLIELQGDELEAVLRPIFAESGIGERFFRDRAAFKAAQATAAEEETAQVPADT
ncbi:MAG: hypothetical protein M3O91_01445 [Chloroflexota bacterium]|nr:hypothetical protein [Chloroflexota bacterium]